MVQVVQDSKTYAESLVKGENITSPEVLADNAALRGERLPAAAPKANGEPKAPPEGTQAATGETEAEDDIPELPETMTKQQATAIIHKNVGKKVRQLKEAEEFAAGVYNNLRLAETRMGQLERENQRLKSQPAQAGTVAAPPGEPKRENFATDAEYANSLIDWRVDQRLKVEREQERQQRVIAQGRALVQRAEEIVPDFKEVTDAAESIMIPQHIVLYMQESPMLPELAYHFAKHPEDLERLASLPVGSSLVALGKIEAIIKPFVKAASVAPAKTNGNGAASPSDNGQQPSTETVTAPSRPRASAPISPLNTSSAGQIKKPVSEMSYSEAKLDWQKRTGKSLTNRKRH